MQIMENASFSSAFQNTVGWKWASNVVGAGASLGIVASLLVAMLGQARYLCVIGRARLVPVWLAKVHPFTGTPLNATIFLGRYFGFFLSLISSLFHASRKNGVLYHIL